MCPSVTGQTQRTWLLSNCHCSPFGLLRKLHILKSADVQSGDRKENWLLLLPCTWIKPGPLGSHFPSAIRKELHAVVLDVHKSSKGLRVHGFILPGAPATGQSCEGRGKKCTFSFFVFVLQICLSKLSFAGVNFRHGGQNNEQNKSTGPTMCFICWRAFLPSVRYWSRSPAPHSALIHKLQPQHLGGCWWEQQMFKVILGLPSELEANLDWNTVSK